MGKKLSDMTNEELWRLFPIVLTEHKDYWAEWYREEEEKLKSILPCKADYHHIGSTAVNSIMAKPIVDILTVVQTQRQMKDCAEVMQKNGYIVMSENENRISLNKGYTENGFEEKVFHIHLRLKGDGDEIIFRDLLNSCEDIAKEYEQLKLRLWKQYEFNREAYTEAKTEFVKKHTDEAKRNLRRK